VRKWGYGGIVFVIINLFFHPINLSASDNDINVKINYTFEDTQTYDYGNFNFKSERWALYAMNRLNQYYYYDKKSITRSKGIARVWVKYFGPKAFEYKIDNLVKYFSGHSKEVNALYEIDCNKRIKRELEWQINQWDGGYKLSSGVTDWKNIPPESIDEILLEKVCKEKPKGGER